MSSGRTLTTDSVDFGQDDPDINHNEPWIFRLLNRAAAFGDVLTQQPSAPEGKEETNDADVVGLLGRDLASLSIKNPEYAKHHVCGAPDRFVHLGASSWLKCPFGKNPGLSGSSESESDEEAAREDELHTDDRPAVFMEEPERLVSSSPPPSTPPGTPPSGPVTPPVVPASPPPEVSPLTPEEKVALIISEFGPLTGPDEQEEHLLVESDASFFQDIVILGVIHITTHRVTFHASLLDTRPDLAPANQVLHAGSAIVRCRKGLRRRRRRVWLELTPDMVTSFRSSDERARTRPLRTVLLSAFREIFPVDPTHSHVVRIEFSSGADQSRPEVKSPGKTPRHSLRTFSLGHKHQHKRDVVDMPDPGTVEEEVEFDTEEAALAWRRELQAALYMFRLRRRNMLTHTDEESANDRGVRINVPFASVKAHQVTAWTNFGTILQLDLDSNEGAMDAGLTRSRSHSLATSGRTFTSLQKESPFGSGTDPLSSGWMPPCNVAEGVVPDQLQQDCVTQLQFAILRANPVFQDLDALVAHAQAHVHFPDEAGAVVDFGALTFVEPGIDTFHGKPAQSDVVKFSKEREVRKIFGITEDVDIWVTQCSLARTINVSGLLAVSPSFICFWSRLVAASDVKLRFHTTDVRAVQAADVRGCCFGLRLQVRGQRDMVLEFSSKSARDEAIQRINALLQSHQERPSLFPSDPSTSSVSTSSFDSATAILSPMSRTLAHVRMRTFPPAVLPYLIKPINVPPDIPYGAAPRHFVCLTIGSRGDVQPYIALGRGLHAAGHRVTLVTHEEYREWIQEWGIGHRTAGGDPGALMKLSVEHKMFSPQFFKESLSNFRAWIDQLLLDAWDQCKDADVLIESPPAMAGVHIAEALNIPYFRAFTMPWSKTTQYPHAFISPPVENSGRFNTASYVLFDNVFWLSTSRQINKWRKKHLGLEATDMGHLAQAQIPFLYNFSPSVVPKPLDWGDHITVTGYWFLDNPDMDWTPPADLVRFIRQARLDSKPLVYIGFGSITVPHAREMTRSIIKGVLKSGMRAILSKGWSSRMENVDEPQVELPPDIYGIDKVPHDWLFPQVDAALHHGGAGTTGASLRAGIPTLIKPWFGDQFFWASRVHRLGAGLRVSSLRSSDLADVLRKATTNRVMREKASQVGEMIAQEDGVTTAIKAIYTYLHRARQDRTTLEK